MHLLSPETRITFYGVSYSANHFTNGYFQDWVDRHYLKLMIKLIENHLWCRAQYVQFVILMDVLSTLLNVLNTIPLLEHHSPEHQSRFSSKQQFSWLQTVQYAIPQEMMTSPQLKSHLHCWLKLLLMIVESSDLYISPPFDIWQIQNIISDFSCTV